MIELLERLALGQVGALVLGWAATFAVFGDRKTILGRRNAALLALLAMSTLLLDILDVGPAGQAWRFDLIFLVTGGTALWGLFLSRRPWADWTPRVPVVALQLITALFVLNSVLVTLTRRPDDAGLYTNLGAQRWTETGVLPYGDPLLKGPDSPAFGAAATYGPILYLGHIPTQWVVGRPGNSPEADPMDDSYERPPLLSTQITVLVFFLAGLWAFFLIAKRRADDTVAWAMVAVLAAMPYFVGLGGEQEVIGGLRFASHVMPMTLTLFAFLALDRPVWAGVLLAVSAGALYYPAFFFPVWLAWYFFRDRGEAVRFTAGFGVAGLVLGALVIHFTQAGPDESAIRLFVESTLEHQEGAGQFEYGASSFTFWTHRPSLAAILQTPIFGSSSLFKPTFLAFLGFVGVCAALARNRSALQLAALTGAVAAAIQLWKTHATGSYVEWYLPFIMLALFAQSHVGTEADPDSPDLT